MCTCVHVSERHHGIKVTFVPESPGVLVVEFDTVLYKEPMTSDFELYGNMPDNMLARQIDVDSNSKMVKAVLSTLFFDDECLGVEKVKVKRYGLIITHSRAVSADEIAELVRRSIPFPAHS